MNKEPIKCDHCGRFVSYADLESGDAVRWMITPDTHLTREEFETKCKQCLQAEGKNK